MVRGDTQTNNNMNKALSLHCHKECQKSLQNDLETLLCCVFVCLLKKKTTSNRCWHKPTNTCIASTAESKGFLQRRSPHAHEYQGFWIQFSSLDLFCVVLPPSLYSDYKVHSHGPRLWKGLIAAILSDCMSHECRGAKCLQLHPVIAFWEWPNDCGRTECALIAPLSSPSQRSQLRRLGSH